MVAKRVAIVTGSGSGLGAATSIVLAKRGLTIVATDIDGDAAERVAAQIRGSGGEAHAAALDVADERGVQNLVSKVVRENTRVDVLANSAGIAGPGGKPSHELLAADFEKTLAVNLFGSIHLTNAVMPHMIAAGYGRIVHVASIAGKEGNPNMAPYNTSKAGMIGFVKGVAKEVARHGVTVNAVAPAVIRSPMNEAVPDDTLRYMLEKIPIGRLGEPEEVAELIAFITSAECSFTTGFVFDASGGRATY
jgi:3-oxoacyl-[acyl-carrier protein] reductase